MTKSQALDFPRIALDDIEIDLHLIRRYPADLAYRFHSIPIAETEDHCTIVMAEPEDQLARAEIQKAFSKQAYVLRGDPEIVDSLIQKYIPNTQRGRILVCCPSHRATCLTKYAHEYCPVFGTDIVDYCFIDNASFIKDEFIDSANGYQLVFLSAPHSSFDERIIRGSWELRTLERFHTPCLLPRSPRLPIQSIMLVLHKDGSDRDTVDLVSRIAASKKARVIVLVLLPQVPTMYQGLNRMRYSLSDILHSQSKLGSRLRRISTLLCRNAIHGEIHLKQGHTDFAIQEEIAESDIDLIVTAKPGKRRFPIRVTDDIVTRMLRWIERPVLLTT
jgi:hypothetical protein